MPNPIFPLALKPVVSKGYSFKMPANVIEQPVNGGLPLIMLDYKTSLVPFSVVLILTSFRLQVWNDFYFSLIASGTGKFEMQLDSGLGLETNICNLVPSTIQTNTRDSNTWIVSFTILAENTAAQSSPFGGSLVEFFEVFGDEGLLLLDRLTIFVLEDVPEVFS